MKIEDNRIGNLSSALDTSVRSRSAEASRVERGGAGERADRVTLSIGGRDAAASAEDIQRERRAKVDELKALVKSGKYFESRPDLAEKVSQGLDEEVQLVQVLSAGKGGESR